MSKLVTDITFYRNQTILELEDGDTVAFVPTYPDGTRMTLDELEDAFFTVEHKEIYALEEDDT